MNSRAITILSCAVAFLFPVSLQGQGRSTWLSAAVDAQGARHRGSEYVGRAPWINDAIKKVTPHYPFADGEYRNEGSGLLRLTLDLKTGSVSNVTVLKSTGHPELDRSAIDAFRRWLWKPGKWKEIEMPVTFAIVRPR